MTQPETPQADYEELRRLIVRDIGSTGSVSEPMLRLLHRLRPRGVKLTALALVSMRDHVDRRDYFLCCTRKADAHLPIGERRVCSPGGHVDPEDFRPSFGSITDALKNTVKVAAVRELEEETGLKGVADCIVHMDIDECGTLCYVVRILYDNPAKANKPEAGTALLWLTKDQLLARAAWPGYYRRAAEAGIFDE